MKYQQSLFSRILLCLIFLATPLQLWGWTRVVTADGSIALPRHETGAVTYQSKLYLLGGRSTNNLQTYDPATNIWTDLGPLPLEMHHFQPVEINGSIYVIGSFSCCYPDEVTIADIYRYNIQTAQWTIAGAIPANRLRGSAGTAVRNGKIYLVGGNTSGHNGGAVPWFDEYDPQSGTWTVLPDAPNARDHFSAVIIDNKLVAAAGRRSARSAGNTVAATDVYDFASGQWSGAENIITPRGGAMAVSYGSDIYVLGGETIDRVESHRTVEAYNVNSGQWSIYPNMLTARHAGGAAVIGNVLHVMTGNLTRGGGNEVSDHETLVLTESSTEGPTDPGTGGPTTPVDLLADTDGDGLTDQEEISTYSTDPNKKDTDNDGLEDRSEIEIHLTDPLQADTDQDGITDKSEIDQNLDPNSNDTDNDNLSDGAEINIHNTDPLDSDTDNDQLKDGDEINLYNSDPTSNDTDKDNIPDGFEVNTIGSNPASADSDNDGLGDDIEYHLHKTSVTNPDTDGDSLSDLDEIATYSTDPLSADSDGDGISDGVEVSSGNSPNNLDDDGDGLLNTADGLTDDDDDGIPNYKDRDSDNDGIPDLVENGFSDVDFDGVLDTKEELEAAREAAEAILEQEQEQEQEQESNEPIEPIEQQPVRDTRSIPLLDDENPGSSDLTETTSSSNDSNESEIQVPTPIEVALDQDEDGIPNYLDLDSDQDGISDYVESTSNYESNVLRNTTYTDANLDGLDDSYSEILIPRPHDSDMDGQPNFLDLDSNNDGSFDVVEAGNEDLNEDGMLDTVVDENYDGIADMGLPVLGEALPDEDNDSIPDLIDIEASSGGCTLATGSTSTDPTIPLTLIFLLAMVGRHRLRSQMG